MFMIDLCFAIYIGKWSLYVFNKQRTCVLNARIAFFLLKR